MVLIIQNDAKTDVLFLLEVGLIILKFRAAHDTFGGAVAVFYAALLADFCHHDPPLCFVGFSHYSIYFGGSQYRGGSFPPVHGRG